MLCEGDYYYVDTTWGDPVFQSEEGSAGSKAISIMIICAAVTRNCSGPTRRTETWSFPECTKMDWNYYVVNGMYYTDYDGEQILKRHE